MRLFSSSTFSLSSLCSSSFASFPPRALLLHFSPFSTSSSSSRRHDDDSRNVRVSVWWDFENCNIPAGVNAFKITHFITDALRLNGIKGPLKITAFGDVLQLSRADQEALSSSGITLTHIPQGGKNSADMSLLVDLLYWVSQNPPPAHLFLISGDRDFASILHRLRMKNYNVLLASTESAPDVLCSAASIMWHWNALIRGENLVGRHFIQPPDGPYGSWYGHYKAPLEDPFLVNEQSSSLRAEGVSELNSDPKPRPIPKTVIRQISFILKLYPKGISISELRSQLEKSNIPIDRDFYGHKKFSRFLLSMPDILKLQSDSDGQFIVRLVTRQPIEPLDSSRRGNSDKGTEEQGRNLIAKSNNTGGSSTESVSGPVLPSSELNAQDRPVKVQPSSELVKSTGEAMEGEPSTCPVSQPLVIEDSKQTSKLEADSNMIPSIGQHFEAKKGLFRRIWRRFVGSKDHNSEKESHHVSVKCSSENASKQEGCSGRVTTCSSDSLEEAKSVGKIVKPMSQDANSVHPISNSPDCESTKLQKTAVVASAYDDKSSSNPGLLGSIRNWFRFWGNDTENRKVSEHCCEQNQLKNQPGKHHLFSSNSFWQDMQSFMETPKGVEIISRSKTRSEMAQNLLEGGPLVLKSLSISELFNLLELLISDKKWVEECTSEINPFKLTLSTARKSSCTKPLHRANGLTSIFMNNKGSQGSSEHDSDSNKQNENISEAGISTTLTKSKFPERSKSEILWDCQKLVDEILSENPEGYNMRAFRKQFLEKYGYHLELQKLGYPKLASLMQTMPGVTTTSSFIVSSSNAPKVSNLATALPCDPEKKTSHVVANSDNESTDLPQKNDNFESVWEELGPECIDYSSRNDEKSTLSNETTEAIEKETKIYYEVEDKLTESDGESCPTIWRSEEQAKPRTNEEKIALLQELDSWYSSKEDNERKDKSENSDDKASQPSLQESSEHDSDSNKQNENISQAGISTTMTKSKFPERARSEMLRDCQRLVDEILSEHPEGYNMSTFRNLFLKKYGYQLDLQKLGYPRLVSLLQTMPGVTTTYSFIVSSSKATKVSNLATALPCDPEKKTSHVVANSDNESTDLPQKNDNFDSVWEELGPECIDYSSRNDEKSTLSNETTEAIEKETKIYYELEDKLTESDGESCPTTWRSEEQAKPRTNEEKTALLQELDSWYSSKEDNERKDKSENSDDKASQPSLQESSEHDSDSNKQNENISQAGISTTMTKSKFPERARSEMLRDCQRLVDEILSEHPEGYNMSTFRNLFLKKYGYQLDLQKLGYPRLVSLLQTMPGVTTTYSFIVSSSKATKVSNLATALPCDPEKKTPHVVANSDNESTDLPQKNDDFESVWEELGPECIDYSSRNDEKSTSSNETTEAIEKETKVYYELEDKLTESDGESCPPTTLRSEEQAKPRTNQYSSKDDNERRKDKSENSDVVIDCSENSLKLSSLAAKSEASVGSLRKKRHQKRYSFVSDTDANDKLKLIDGILGTLKKSS